MGALLAGLAGAIIQTIAAIGPFALAIWGVFKTYLATFLIQAFVVVIAYNFIVDLVQEVINFALSRIGAVSGGLSTSGVVQLSGVGAYLADHLQLAQCLSFSLSIILVKFLLRKIPFLRW